MPHPIYAASPQPIPAPPEPGLRLVSGQHIWRDYTGLDWDLSGGSSGLALQTGVRGMHMPPILRYASKAPAVAGSLWRGSITDEREVFWPIKVFTDGDSQDWIDHNRKFWDTLTPEKTGQWIVVQPNGATRYLTCRYAEEENDADDISPELMGWIVYGIHLVAERPYWEGSPITRSYGAAGSGQNYYGGDAGGGFGPPFFISQGSSLTQASINNPGQVGAWPTWTVFGPLTGASTGLNGRAITFPFTLSTGQWVRINTDPTDQVCRDWAGVDRTAELTSVQFTEIPPGVNLPLEVSTIGGLGRVEVSITPRYYRAY